MRVWWFNSSRFDFNRKKFDGPLWVTLLDHVQGKAGDNQIRPLKKSPSFFFFAPRVSWGEIKGEERFFNDEGWCLGLQPQNPFPETHHGVSATPRTPPWSCVSDVTPTHAVAHNNRTAFSLDHQPTIHPSGHALAQIRSILFRNPCSTPILGNSPHPVLDHPRLPLHGD